MTIHKVPSELCDVPIPMDSVHKVHPLYLKFIVVFVPTRELECPLGGLSYFLHGDCLSSEMGRQFFPLAARNVTNGVGDPMEDRLSDRFVQLQRKGLAIVQVHAFTNILVDPTHEFPSSERMVCRVGCFFDQIPATPVRDRRNEALVMAAAQRFRDIHVAEYVLRIFGRQGNAEVVFFAPMKVTILPFGFVVNESVDHVLERAVFVKIVYPFCDRGVSFEHCVKVWKRCVFVQIVEPVWSVNVWQIVFQVARTRENCGQ